MNDAQAEFEQAVPDYTCNECGEPYPRKDLLEISDHLICGSCKPLVLQRVKEGGPIVESENYGGFGIRAGAKILDYMILGVISMIVNIGFGSVITTTLRQSEPVFIFVIIAYQILWMTVWLGYNTYFLGKFAATPGKMACSLEVVTADHDEISYLQALGRTAAEILSGMILYIGYIMAAFDDEKRTLHDRIASTRVIKK